MTAIITPRQYDIEARSLADETSAGSLLNFTGNFFPRESHGKARIREYKYSFMRLEFYRQNYFVEPHIPNYQGSALYEVTAIDS